MSEKPTHEQLEKRIKELEQKLSDTKRPKRRLDEINSALNESPIALLRWRAEPGRWQLEFVSENIKKIVGYAAEELMSGRITWPEIAHPDDDPCLEKEVETLLAKGTDQWSQQYRLITNKNEIRWIKDWSRVVRNPDGTITHVLAVIFDITDSKNKEEAFGEKAEKNCPLKENINDAILTHGRAEAGLPLLATAIEQATENIFITDAEGTIQYVNPAFERVTGYRREEVIGKNPRILQSGEHDRAFYQDMWNTLKAGRIWQGRMVNRRKDGALFTEEASISPVYGAEGRIVNFVAVKRDITAELKMAEQLQQAQRLEAIGTLAGGIAHDFNNILFPIFGYAEIIKRQLPSYSALQKNLDAIIGAAERGRALVQQILAFSRHSKPEPRAIQLQPIVKETLKLLRSSISSNIDMKSQVSYDCEVVMADPIQLHQLVMNLVTNAYHSMEQTGGTLYVSLEQVAIGPEDMGNTDLIPGDYACLTIADTGVGMEKDILEKVFDPYFTTKAEGKGTGLGLSVVHGIVKNYDGDIRAESEPGKGSTFYVYLPISTPKKLDETPAASTEPIQGGSEKILLVDDEEAIVHLEKQMLERLGYQIGARTSSVEALEAFKANPDRYDLVLTDMAMPNMTGVQLARKIREIRSDIPIIVLTGYSELIDEEKIKALGIQGYLMKPAVLSQLAATIRKVLDKGEPNSD